MRRLLILAIAACLFAASPAAAADTPVVTDSGAEQVAALGGTVAWVTSTPDGRQRLMLLRDGRTGPVAGAPPARFYRSLDLGRDRDGSLVLTYVRCATVSRCVVRRDDLAGRRAGVAGLEPPGCSLTTAPALWRTRAAYGLACHQGSRDQPRRSGVYVKTGSGPPQRLPRPTDAARFGVTEVTSVDLRGRRVASVYEDIYAYAVAQDVDGRPLDAFLAGASEGDSDQHARGLALGAGGVLWSLTTAEHAGDPLQTVINRLDGDCRQFELLTSAGADFPAIDLAVDGATVYLVVPKAGIVRHDFTPQRPCS